ncbi:1-deoxy-D-xylulose 5-phosphate reductoisomerase [Sporobacter termitidis DSM 10068]|uniref:1-deoxy-D-xylulose 5-phosphate reductoisomerase n=1 Tax=Sporobacter termitidis DSM 10068 TaxID=1123282 RepID=A0A1M5VKS2_9FIRM|nr:1-deoxy-D-xylulose-5-phosphate reductoisomerase [Sporobacter termitidis]SHH75841.1 1-deoxy-D-xylulose 5-phosphate reductoisomerase [Sporobacter termitidis DSM 10068]
MEKKKISLLGSTGSVGRQTLEVADLNGLDIRALSTNRSTGLLEAQARKYAPGLVAVYDEDAARDMKTRLRDTPIRVASGPEGLIEAAAGTDADIVVTAVVGTVGLPPTLAAIEAGKCIALANKETLVCAGAHVMRLAKARRAEILPVDSEHSAIFQCLRGNPGKAFKKILLTASGGPFRGKTRAELEHITLNEALSHPNWSMGKKITVDSATLMNKGLEFIEAMHLYGAAPDQIEILVHPQSIVHSMVEFCDSAVIAQLSVPDMRLPIQYALTYPERRPSLTAPLDFTKIGPLTFEAPDLDVFRCLKLALDTAEIPGTACAVMNAANEAAVSLFLEEKIAFSAIYECVAAALDRIRNIEAPSIDDILAADLEARGFVAGLYHK